MAQNLKQEVGTFFSGGPGTTGREVFEDSTASGPGASFRGTGGTTGGAAPDLGGRGVTGSSVDVPDRGTSLSNSGSKGVQDIDRKLESTNIGSGNENHTPHTHHSHEGQGHIAHAKSEAREAQAIGAGAGADYASRNTGEHTGHGDSYGANTGGVGAGGAYDRVGRVGQDAAMYERTGDKGPATTGAAGTDRFDTDKPRDRTGATGNSYGASDAYPDLPESHKRAEGQSTGGLMGILGTSDKDFTGRDRVGGTDGAYADTHGRFEGNTSGPGGNSALTGREGNIEKNPVAQAKAEVENTVGSGHTGTTPGTGNTTASALPGTGSTSGSATTTTSAAGTHSASHGHHHGSSATPGSPVEKKGLFQKIKEAL